MLLESEEMNGMIIMFMIRFVESVFWVMIFLNFSVLNRL